MLKKTKIFTSLLLISAMVVGSASIACATTVPKSALVAQTTSVQVAAQPREAIDITMNAYRSSRTTGRSEISAGFAGRASSYSVVATLQERSDGSWRTATGVSPTTDSVSGTRSVAGVLYSDWNLKSDRAYRVKWRVVDTIDGTTYSGSYYSDSF